MKTLFLRIERSTTAVALLAACAMLAVAASLGLFQIITRFILQTPA